jgi:16S rRNA (uracil1498-N3)-methyltransferase
MPKDHVRGPRLYVDQAIEPGGRIALTRSQAHYLHDVLRLRPGDAVLVFNGADGEWMAESLGGERTPALVVREQTRVQSPAGDLDFLFAPLKHVRLDYLSQKAVEMGVSRLRPVLTRYTQIHRVNLARMRANAIEAAEQCGVLSIPGVCEPVALTRLLADWLPDRLLVFCDETAATADPVEMLRLACAEDSSRLGPIGVLIGPEGGFAEEERRIIAAVPKLARLALGPRILRADTAAVAALALVQAVLGDWR